MYDFRKMLRQTLIFLHIPGALVLVHSLKRRRKQGRTLGFIAEASSSVPNLCAAMHPLLNGMLGLDLRIIKIGSKRLKIALGRITHTCTGAEPLGSLANISRYAHFQ